MSAGIPVTVTRERQTGTFGQLGGPCPLPQPWPVGEAGQPLTHAFTLWSDALHGLQVGDEVLGAGEHISVFLPYDPDEYFLELITYHGDLGEWATLQANVDVRRYIPAAVADPPAKAPAPLPQFYLTAAPDARGQVSRLGTAPDFLQPDLLQQEPLPALSGLRPVLQLGGLDLPSELGDLFYLAENVGYLYLSREAGVFFVQAT